LRPGGKSLPERQGRGAAGGQHVRCKHPPDAERHAGDINPAARHWPWRGGAGIAAGLQRIEFFPITRADAFDRFSAPGLSRRAEAEVDLSGIDFDKQFAFLVAHPSSSSYGAVTSGQYAKYFSKVLPSYEKDRVVLRIDASRLGDIDPMTAMTGKWEGSVYAVERRGRDKLEVRLYDDSYVYSLAADANTGMPMGAVAPAQ